MNNIPFNNPPVVGNEIDYIKQALKNNKLCGDGPYTKKCQQWFENEFSVKKTLLTPSCTHALELSAILLDIKEGDEVIMPSYTFVSTANAFVLRGAKIVFVDVRKDTMNIDETKIEAAITEKTKVIVPVHYAGVACEMDTIMSIAHKYKLFVVEDAAQGVMSTYKGKPLGTVGHLGAFSFHETKNYTSAGEGGLLLINDETLIERAEIIREKGTDRSQFLRGQVDKYSWVDIGSSLLMNDISAAYLLAQMEGGNAQLINRDRLNSWKQYYDGLVEIASQGHVELPSIPEGCEHNAHMFYVKLDSLETRTQLIQFLRQSNIQTAFHYVPLHSSAAGKVFSRFSGQDEFTTLESNRLLRLPLWYGLNEQDIEQVCNEIKRFFQGS
ncbi:dTDP-4-amino-4,6-dideoxygalactose transaminase [Pseudoalteromonas rubra]|uniref:dTDP-4-amino-4,6-dideoxygalactose transaminase n=1 Tax=Pseudoalteromonas rubra TaxID=43658 RepID=A0A5S3WS30_9GAMM|nr:dTDP-4-amino-4,6-dideoxygalactose transaminase [Pseudoalteromonas rubra]TMP31464.1 dTDP-4-amino-4,6-dideoxygalactose transaminase [Pseudoalteromonas rubra]TMP34548.1 dTDP-4-amino-4,6-dideoxygalactose transaminase [Pseudoalteromonas rubra]